MTAIIRINGIDHWVRTVVTDGSSEGVDYDVVYVYCQIEGMRFARRRDKATCAPLRQGIVPKCLGCYVGHTHWQAIELYAYRLGEATAVTFAHDLASVLEPR